MDWKSVGNWISDTLVKVDDFVWVAPHLDISWRETREIAEKRGNQRILQILS